MSTLLSKVLLRVDEVFVDDVVDVAVVGVKELLDLTSLRVVQEQTKVLKKKIMTKII